MSRNSGRQRLHNSRCLRQERESCQVAGSTDLHPQGCFRSRGKGGLEADKLGSTNYKMLNSLFMTITNAHFDDASIEKQINNIFAIRDSLKDSVKVNAWHDVATFVVNFILQRAVVVGVLATENEDVCSLSETIILSYFWQHCFCAVLPELNRIRRLPPTKRRAFSITDRILSAEGIEMIAGKSKTIAML